MVRVDLNKVFPFLGDLRLGKYGVDRALNDTGVAINAFLGVNENHRVVITAMDTIHGTNVDAGLVFDANARFYDHVCHCPGFACR